MQNGLALREHLKVGEIFHSEADGSRVRMDGSTYAVGLAKESERKNIWDIIISQAARNDEAEMAAYCKDAEAFMAFMREHAEEAYKLQGYEELLSAYQRHFTFGGVETIPPLTNRLNYAYDFGDGWELTITAEDAYTCTENWAEQVGLYADAEGREGNINAEEIIQNIKTQLKDGKFFKTREKPVLVYGRDGKYIDGEMYAKVLKVYRTAKPVCIAKDGLNVLDDVGGVGGYIDFLQEINEGEREQRGEMKEWAKGQGWTGRDYKLESML